MQIIDLYDVTFYSLADVYGYFGGMSVNVFMV
jgi:hypothetical protein